MNKYLCKISKTMQIEAEDEEEARDEFMHKFDLGSDEVEVTYVGKAPTEFEKRAMAISALSELGTKANEAIKPYVELAHSVSAENKCFYGMTNGEVIQTLFPKVSKYNNMLLENHSRNILFDDNWWNAPYKRGDEE